MAYIRRARADDLMAMETCHSMCLSRSFKAEYYILHLVMWPALQFVAHDHKGRLVAFMLARIKQQRGEHRSLGRITCLAMQRTHKKLGLHVKFIVAAKIAMQQVYRAAYLSVHVRRSDRAEFDFYTGTMGFEVHALLRNSDEKGEEGYDLRVQLDGNESHPELGHQHGVDDWGGLIQYLNSLIVQTLDQPFPELADQLGGEWGSGEVESRASDEDSTSEPETYL